MNYTDKVTNIIDKLDLPKDMAGNKEIIKARFVEEVSYYEKKEIILKNIIMYFVL